MAMKKTDRIAKKLNEAGVVNYEIKDNKTVCIAVFEDDGFIDLDRTLEEKNKAMNALNWGGFNCAGGHWYLMENYRPIQGDWNDKTSEYHY